MRTHSQIMKAKGSTRLSTQQASFELKQRVILALNKLGDRDTYQIGVEELEKTVECLNPGGILTFLSCILDTAAEQKSSVRKECIRLMGMLATLHGDLVGPHLGKMVASIIRRLKDPDAIVRDACVETVGVLALKLGNSRGETDQPFVVLVKPLFEALGEQNKQVQCGSALCLAKVIDNTSDSPVAILRRMLMRTVKLLKNPHFMAKPAVIELNRSIIQAGGAQKHNVLSSAMNSIQEALKSSDWATRKAASVALGDIASSRKPYLFPYKASCIRALELCRFDKVKPVRDSILKTLHDWRSLPGCGISELSEAGSSIKENSCCGDYSDTSFSTSNSVRKDIAQKKNGLSLIKRWDSEFLKSVRQNYMENHHQPGEENDWPVKITVPKSLGISYLDVHHEESEGSCNTRSLERTDFISKQRQGMHECIPMDDKQESFSLSNLVIDGFETKFVASSQGLPRQDSKMKPMRTNQGFTDDEINSENKIHLERIQDRRSLDSTVTETSQNMPGCCLHTANEMASIRKQLLEIEVKQSNLMNLLQVLTSDTMDSLSMIQEKVLSLESVVEKMSKELFQCASIRLLKNQNVASPRISSSTPMPSVDAHSRPSSLPYKKNTDIWKANVFKESSSGISTKQELESWMSPQAKIARKFMENGIKKGLRPGTQNAGNSQSRNTDAVFGSVLNKNIRQNNLVGRNSCQDRIKGFLCDGNIDAAYVEALYSGNELTLVELFDKTGPVLESLSHKTISELLCTLASYLLECRYMTSIIPWLQQVVDLCTVHGPNYLVLSANARLEFLSAIQHASNMEFFDPTEKQSITQLGTKLQQIWG